MSYQQEENTYLKIIKQNEALSHRHRKQSIQLLLTAPQSSSLILKDHIISFCPCQAFCERLGDSANLERPQSQEARGIEHHLNYKVKK